MPEAALTSLTEVIDTLGGVAPVAKLTKSSAPAVCNWVQFGRFPAKTYVVMTTALRRKRRSAPASLWGMTEASEAAD